MSLTIEEYLNALRTTAETWGVRAVDILQKSRRSELVIARHAFIYWLYKHQGYSSTDCGLLTGGRDHGTILHALEQIEGRTLSSKKEKREIEQYLSIMDALFAEREKTDNEGPLADLIREIIKHEVTSLN